MLKNIKKYFREVIMKLSTFEFGNYVLNITFLVSIDVKQLNILRFFVIHIIMEIYLEYMYKYSQSCFRKFVFTNAI